MTTLPFIPDTPLPDPDLPVTHLVVRTRKPLNDPAWTPVPAVVHPHLYAAYMTFPTGERAAKEAAYITLGPDEYAVTATLIDESELGALFPGDLRAVVTMRGEQLAKQAHTSVQLTIQIPEPQRIQHLKELIQRLAHGGQLNAEEISELSALQCIFDQLQQPAAPAENNVPMKTNLQLFN